MIGGASNGLWQSLRLIVAILIVAAIVPDQARAAASFQAAGTAVGGTGTVNPAWPTHAVDDIALLFVVSAGGQSISLSIPAGFVEVPNSPQATGAGTAGVRLAVFWARATSTSMATPRVADPGDHVYAQIITYRGVINTGNPWDVTGGGVKAAAGTSVTVTGVTTTVPDTLIVQAVGRDTDSAAAAFSNETNANLSGIAERTDAGTTLGTGGGFAVWDGIKATAGATGNTTATVTSSVNAFLTIALKPQVPTVTSIVRAGTDPAYAADPVSWTVTFSTSVSGVNALDFALVQGGGASGASITSVTGSGTTWTVTADSGTSAGTLGLNLVDDDSIVDGFGNKLGGTGLGNGNFTGEVYTLSPPFCSPPANVPAGVTVSCTCDRFGRANLNPSTIFGANWIVSKSDGTAIVPYINATTGNLRLTENTGNNAKAATVPGIFPAAGNYISVEFQHYAYGGSGADGIAVTLSDYSVTAVPGAFGGSLGYAQKTGAACPTLPGTPCPGFAGGWIGVGIDEFGNYQNPTEGRIGGPGSRVDSIGLRGSGSGDLGYNWLAGTNTLNPQIDNTGSATPAPGYYYQVIVDARNDPTSTSVQVNRNTGSGYASLINVANVYTAATAQGFTQSPVPANWQISFTGSTGGSTNIHEIGGLKVCAQSVAPPSGGTAGDFNAIDEAYGTPPSGPAVQSFLNGHIYTKLVGTPFKLNVAALSNSQILTTYAAGSSKNVTVKLVDNSDNVCVLDDTQPNFCNSACKNKSAVVSQTMTFVSGDQGKKKSSNFTINAPYKNLVAIINDSTTTACSTDGFAVRPQSISVTSSATQSGTSGGPAFAAGANFSITATVAGTTYNGTPKFNGASSVQAFSPATFTGTLAGGFPAATPSGADSSAAGTFTYTEVGAFQLLGPNFAVPRIPGVYDDTWTIVDSVPSKNDCNSGTNAAAYSNTIDASGKFGCNFGITGNSLGFGRFTPAYFDVMRTHGCPAGGYTYGGVLAGPSSSPVGQPFSVTAIARNTAGAITQNYHSAGSIASPSGFAKDTAISNAGVATGFTNNILTAGTTGSGAAPFVNGVATTNMIYYSLPVKETAPLTLTLRAAESPGGDGVSSVGHLESTTEIRSGRVQVQNVFGSELAALSMPVRVQYYQSAANGWVMNSADGCTSLGSIALASPADAGSPKTLSIPVPGSVSITVKSPAGNSTVSLTGAVPSQTLFFTAPGGAGYVDAAPGLSALPWLRFDWDGNGAHDNDPSGRASFGIYKGSPRNIYLRERY